MRSALRAALLALAVLVGTAAPAPGASSATTIHLPQSGQPGQAVGLAGPVFAGDAVAFGRPTPNGYEVVVRRGAHAAISRVAIPGPAHVYRRFVSGHLEASDSRLVLALTERVCRTREQCNTPGGAQAVYAAVLTGGLDGGKLRRLAGCTGEAGCRSRPQCRDLQVDVSGDVVAFDGCRGGVHVRDLSPNASPSGRDYPAPARYPRIAGPFVAFVKAGGDIQVTNWRTGADAYAVTRDSYGAFDLQADGKLVYELACCSDSASRRAWASPAEPFAHVWSDDALFYTEGLRIAGDLLAYQTSGSSNEPDPSSSFGSILGVHDLSAAPPPDSDDPGQRATYSDPWSISSFDFDGARLTWITRVCRRSWLNVWDLQDERPPMLPRGGCPWPSIVKGSVHVDAQKRLRVTLDCPADPPVGCIGSIATERGGEVRYSIPAGERRTKQLGSQGLCRDASGRVRAKIFFLDFLGYGHFHKTVTVHGATAQLPRC